MIVQKTAIFPVSRETVFQKIQQVDQTAEMYGLCSIESNLS